MTSYESMILAPILAHPILSRSSYQSLARLLPHVTERRFEAGEVIFRSGEPADHLFLMLGGKTEVEAPEVTRIMMRDQEGDLVTLDAKSSGVERKRVLMNQGHLGEEAATGTPTYLSNATAVEAGRALLIPRARLALVLDENPGLRSEFYETLIYRFGGQPARRAESKARADAAPEDGSWARIIGLLCTIVLPALILGFADRLALDRSSAAFLAILAASTAMWVFELVDEYIPALFAMLATLLLGIAPTSVALSGFSSPGFFMAMSILGLGALIVASGLSYRFLLVLLKYLPNQPFWHHAGLVLTGMLLTPLVPSMNARIALVGPFMNDMADVLRYRPGSKGFTEMGIGAFNGATIFSPVFLTSKSANFVVLGLLSTQSQLEFSWLGWAFAGAAYGITVLCIYVLMVLIMFRRETTPTFSKEQVTSQLQLFGPLKNREIAAIAGIAIFGIGVVTASVHKVQVSWLGLAILYGLLLFGFLRKDEFKKQIDWTLLIYLGGLGGIMSAFNYLELDQALAENLVLLGGYMRSDFRVFVILLLGAMFVLRLALPINAAIVLSAAILMPLAEIHGVHPWVVGFIVLVFGEFWFLGYQCSYYNPFRRDTGGAGGFDEKQFLKFNAIFNTMKVVGILVSIPVWSAMGLL